MEISSAPAAVAANIAPTAKQIILLTLILIPFRLAANVNIAPPQFRRRSSRSSSFPRTFFADGFGRFLVRAKSHWMLAEGAVERRASLHSPTLPSNIEPQTSNITALAAK